MKGRRGRGLGFTMIEIVIVLAVIAVLSSLCIARYLEAKDKARVTAAQSDLGLLRQFLAFYSTDYDCFPAAASSYDELKNQLRGPDGLPYGTMPLSNCYTWLSYNREGDMYGSYVVRVEVEDRLHTVLVATPEMIARE